MNLRAIGIVLLFLAFAAPVEPAQTTLAERYRAGSILVRADEDWTPNLPPDLVFESRGDIAVAPDGSVFVSNTSRHTIYKFDRSGKFVKRFGQKGQGPGDLTYPGRISILDGRCLVVGEYATNQRVSVFDLDGKFIKTIGTGRFTSQPIALKDGKIAYVCIRSRNEPDEMISVEEVFVLDERTGAQKPVTSYEIRNPAERLPGGVTVVSSVGGVVLSRTLEGGLIVGMTGSPSLDIFSADGTKLRTLDTGWKAIPVTAEYRAKLWALQLRKAEAEGRKLPTGKPLVPELLPIINDVWTDSEGNILVCKNTDCLEACPVVIRAFSPLGDYLCDFTLDPDPFILSADYRFKRIVLTGAGLYGLLELKDDPDGFLHLVRTVFRPQ